MATPRRQQNRSCDYCRRRKRACDAPVPRHIHESCDWDAFYQSTSLAATPLVSCTNCRRIGETCTFNWLQSLRAGKSRKQSLKHATYLPTSRLSESSYANLPYRSWLNDPFSPSAPLDGAYGNSAQAVDGLPDGWMDEPNNHNADDADNTRSEEVFDDLALASLDASSYTYLAFEEPSLNESFGWANVAGSDMKTGSTPHLSTSSRDLAEGYARSTMSYSMIRIYHDSLEHTLSCWLNERNLPYSGIFGQQEIQKHAIDSNLGREWGPKWSNRMCLRVCELDRAFAKGGWQKYTEEQEKTIFKTLHLAIMAYATQWTTEATDPTTTTDAGSSASPSENMGSWTSPQQSETSSIRPQQRAVHTTFWNQARHALNSATGLLSFRIIFANIVFFLTQQPFETMSTVSPAGSPSDGESVDSTHEPSIQQVTDLLDKEPVSVHLETALRQLLSFRYKLIRQHQKKPRRRSESFGSPPRAASESSAGIDTSWLNAEHVETLNLMFWLGIMFDTVSAAVQQRPLVVSDEDSSNSGAVSPLELAITKEQRHTIDGEDLTTTKPATVGVWSDYFMVRGMTPHLRSTVSWLYTYEEAAELLSDAAAVKVLLFRRVTRLQTLISRCASPAKLEEAIDAALRVYHHWNRTYGRFLSECVVHHDSLPTRISSWYVLMAGHWHLGAMTFADTLESFDEDRLGFESRLEARQAMNLVATMRRESAIAMSDVAQRSLGEERSFDQNREFHEAVKSAILTEPWTVILVRVFTKAGAILLDLIDEAPAQIPPHSLFDDAYRRCVLCIDALRQMSRKSDPARLCAQALMRGLNARVIHSPDFI